jgi:hypothetical protein
MKGYIQRYAAMLQRTLTILLTSFALIGITAHATDTPAWHKVVYTVPSKPSLHSLADRQQALFRFFLENSLHGEGKKDFLRVTEKFKNNVTWRNGSGKNAYNEAFHRSYDFVKAADLQGMPDTILLIPYMESQWHGKKGDKTGDYGYWQLIPEVIKEIQTLDYVPTKVRETDIDSVRESATLSTQAAQAHLHRYHFYFANVAKYSESDAWLLTLTSFNWGAGNVKRMMADLQADGIEANYANFYHRLYTTHKARPDDVSLAAAVKYVPSLWNVAQLLAAEN